MKAIHDIKLIMLKEFMCAVSAIWLLVPAFRTNMAESLTDTPLLATWILLTVATSIGEHYLYYKHAAKFEHTFSEDATEATGLQERRVTSSATSRLQLGGAIDVEKGPRPIAILALGNSNLDNYFPISEKFYLTKMLVSALSFIALLSAAIANMPAITKAIALISGFSFATLQSIECHLYREGEHKLSNFFSKISRGKKKAPMLEQALETYTSSATEAGFYAALALGFSIGLASESKFFSGVAVLIVIAQNIARIVFTCSDIYALRVSNAQKNGPEEGTTHKTTLLGAAIARFPRMFPQGKEADDPVRLREGSYQQAAM